MKIKYLFFIILSFASLALAQNATVGKPKLTHLDNKGATLPILRDNLENSSGRVVIYLDTMETDTGRVILNVLERPVRVFPDTIATLSMSCKDSTGSDTGSVVLKWKGNPLPDGRGEWSNVDSSTLAIPTAASASTSERGWTKLSAYLIASTGQHASFKFYARNALGSNANRKMMCKDAVAIVRPRTVAHQ